MNADNQHGFLFLHYQLQSIATFPNFYFQMVIVKHWALSLEKPYQMSAIKKSPFKTSDTFIKLEISENIGDEPLDVASESWRKARPSQSTMLSSRHRQSQTPLARQSFHAKVISTYCLPKDTQQHLLGKAYYPTHECGFDQQV